MRCCWSFILILPPAILLAREDFRFREVSVVWLLLLAVAATAGVWIATGAHAVFSNMGTNAVLLSLLWGCSAGYQHIRGRRMQDSFGAGDLAILWAVTPLFQAAGYVRFVLAACVGGLLWWMLLKDRSIPLAGIVAVLLVGYSVCKMAGSWS